MGLNLATDAGYLAAVKPLFGDGLVEAIEWDLDSRWVVIGESADLPSWLRQVLNLYAADGRLYGHSVWLSVLTALTQQRQENWIQRIGHECAQRPYRHICEHHGFMSAGPFVVGPLLPVPFVASAVEVGRERLSKLAEVTGVAIGLENLASALSPLDATLQPAFLESMLAPTEGIILLDIHNVYTQAVNLKMNPSELLARLVSKRVRELHVSGGRWVDIEGLPYRFDGHNGPVPEQVFALAAEALSLCPNVEVVIFERRANSLQSDVDTEGLRADYRRLVQVVHSTPNLEAPTTANGDHPAPAATCRAEKLFPDRKDLARYQDALIEALALKLPSREQQDRLYAHPATEPVRDYIASFVPRCVAAMSLLVRRWGRTAADLATEGIVAR